MAIDAGNIYSQLILDTTGFDNSLKNAEKKSTAFGDSLQKTGKKMEGVGKGLTYALTAPIMGIGTAAAVTAMNFDASMSEVQAISGATGEDLQALEDIAREMGSTTKFSASESVEALKYMAMAGWDTEQMMGGLPGVLALAAASGEDLATTSDIVTDALTAFGLTAEDSGRFADVLATASSSANTNVGMMGETFKYAAPIAGALGYSIEDTALAIGLLANSGIKGSQAGTALRKIFNEMTQPITIAGESIGEFVVNTQNADGSMKDFGGVLEELREVWPQLTEAEQAHNAEMIAGQEAMSGFLAMMNTSDPDFDKLQGNIENSTGKAQEMADVMQDNLAGQITELKSQLEGLAIDFGELVVPAIGDLVEKLSEGVTWFSELDDETKEMIITAGKFAAALGPALFITGKVAGSIGSVVTLMGKLSGGAGLATAAVGTGATGLTGAIGASVLAMAPWIVGFGAAGLAAYQVYKALDEDVIPEVDLFGETVSENTKEVVGGFLDMEKKSTASLLALKGSGQEVSEEMASEMIGTFDEMTSQVVSKLEQQKIDALAELEEMFSESTTMTEEEKEEMLRVTSEKYEDMIVETQKGNDRINEIFTEAAEANRSITENEWEEITKIREDMKEDAILILSDTQAEAETILDNLKNNSSRITAEMASEVITNSIEQKEKSIEQAQEEYEKRLKYAEELRKDGSVESEELAKKIIEEAERQRDDAVIAAEDMHEKIVAEVASQGEDVLKQIDLDNGNIKTKWQTLGEWFDENPIVRKIKTLVEEVNERTGGSTSNYGGISRDVREYTGRNALGTEFFEGGRTWVGEHGPEIIELPTGSKVYSNQDSQAMGGADADSIALALERVLRNDLTKPVNINIDGRTVGKALVKVLNQELENEVTQSMRAKGITR